MPVYIVGSGWLAFVLFVGVPFFIVWCIHQAAKAESRSDHHPAIRNWNARQAQRRFERTGKRPQGKAFLGTPEERAEWHAYMRRFDRMPRSDYRL